jgi:prepilin-type N-terminal cleavage/methylation domain-containing protein
MWPRLEWSGIADRRDVSPRGSFRIPGITIDDVPALPFSGVARPVGEGWMNGNRGQRRRGFSLIEVMTVCIIMGVLAAFSVPRFMKAMEQSRANIAVANLRTIWTAQRAYALQQIQTTGTNTYAPDLDTLRNAKLIDQAIADDNGGDPDPGITYVYKITQTDATTFTASARRVNSTVWTSSLAIDSQGNITGSVDYVGSSVAYRGSSINQFFQ